jgi:large subunit ribosomal protein L24
MQIKKNDTVLVTTGKEKGKRGRVLEVYPSRKRLLVEKLNMIKRHTRPNQQLKQGGIVERESPIAVSNVRLICSKCDKPTAVKRKASDGGKRSRVCTNCNEILD